jgi:hypothetical protein
MVTECMRLSSLRAFAVVALVSCPSTSEARAHPGISTALIVRHLTGLKQIRR